MNKTTRRKKTMISNVETVDNKINQEELEKKKKLVPPKTLNNIKLTEKQLQLVKIIDENDITIITGPGGTAKTFVTCYYALSCLKDHKFEKIILTKPVQEAGENLGFLPGTIDEKIAPHYESYRSTFLKMIDSPTLERNYKNGIIENKPLAFMRGASFENCLIIGDEFQNADIRSLIMFITRMGKGSKIIICGDISQYDIDKQYIALDYLPKLIGDIPGVGVFTFTEDDIMRHSILIEITKRYEMAKNTDLFPKKKKQ